MSLYIKLICRDVTSDEFFEKTFLCLTPIFLFVQIGHFVSAVLLFRPERMKASVCLYS